MITPDILMGPGRCCSSVLLLARLRLDLVGIRIIIIMIIIISSPLFLVAVYSNPPQSYLLHSIYTLYVSIPTYTILYLYIRIYTNGY